MTEEKQVKQRWWDISDILCVVACITILAMSAASYMDTSRMGYQVNTGVFCGIFVLLPIFLKYFHVVRLPTVFVVAIMVAVALHAYGVLLLSYDKLPYYDTITHFLSSTVVAMCVYYTLMCYNAYGGGGCRFEGKGLPIAIALIMLGFSEYWEVFELVVDVTTGTNMQYSPFDTLRDMLCNTFGTLTVAAITGYYMRDKTSKQVADAFSIHPKLKAFINDPFREKKGKQDNE